MTSLDCQPPQDLPIEITALDVKRLLDRGADIVLIDCREQDEHEIAHIEGSVLMPMSEMRARSAELGAYMGKQIVVHCHHGMRSLQVTRWLRQSGFTSAQSMQGGIEAWSNDVDPKVPKY